MHPDMAQTVHAVADLSTSMLQKTLTSDACFIGNPALLALAALRESCRKKSVLPQFDECAVALLFALDPFELFFWRCVTGASSLA